MKTAVLRGHPRSTTRRSRSGHGTFAICSRSSMPNPATGNADQSHLRAGWRCSRESVTWTRARIFRSQVELLGRRCLTSHGGSCVIPRATNNTVVHTCDA